MKYAKTKVIVLTGDYGCGKTNLAVNLALMLCEKGRVSVVDSDTVNPYFRTADFSERLSERGINVVCPMYANTNLDIPVLEFDLESIISRSDYTILDVGGSDAGAYPVGRYSGLLNSLGDELSMLFVMNMYRLAERSAKEAVRALRDIEAACRCRCTALVNNSNLGAETTRADILASAEFAQEVSRLSGLPTAFTCGTEDMECTESVIPVKRLVKLPWEE